MQRLINMTSEERANCLYNLSREDYAKFLVAEGSDQVPFARVFTHVHTDMGSPMDAILTNEQYIKTAQEYGTKYLTITDHGTMYGVQTLYDDIETCNEKKGTDIHLIIGCEYYVCDDDITNSQLKHTRLHLCAYAKDKTGYLALCRLVTDSNYRIIKIGKQQFPCISREMLAKYIGPGTEGYGHVILTSACIGGVLTGISYEQETARTNVEKLARFYKENKRAYDTAIYSNQKIAELEARKSTTSDKEELAKIKTAINEFKKGVTACNKYIKNFNNVGVVTLEEFGKYLEEVSKPELEKMAADIIPESRMVEEMTNAAKWYNECAGQGNFYIEIQYHGIPAEQKYEHTLCDIAHSLNIPLIAGMDAHMQKKSDARTRKYVNSLRFKKWDDVEPADEELYLKTDGDLYRWLTKAVSSKDAIEAICNCMNLAEQCSVKLEKNNHYPVYQLNDEEEQMVAGIPDYFCAPNQGAA